MRDFIEWLSFHPTPDEITRTLVLDHLAAEGACCARIGLLSEDDSLTFLGEYGFTDGLKGQTFTSEQWRSWKHDRADIVLGRIAGPWSPDKKTILFTLRHRGSIQGHLSIIFSKPVKDVERVQELVTDFAIPIALYLSMIHHGNKNAVTLLDRNDTGADQLSARQLSILAGMVEGKTNHELATELGFSVSTIRHETMRIYQALSVSDRKEAAKKALTLAII